MSRPEFAQGFADKREHRGFPPEYDYWDGVTGRNMQWNYERGRWAAVIIPANVPLHVKGKLNPKAIKLFDREIATWRERDRE